MCIAAHDEDELRPQLPIPEDKLVTETLTSHDDWTSPSEFSAQADIPPPAVPVRRPKMPTPAGFRVLHVLVPEQVFNHVKAQAYLSNLRFPDYITRLLQSGQPVVRSDAERLSELPM